MSLSIGEGEMVAVMGPPDSGKSTLLILMGGLDMPTSGALLVLGVDLLGDREMRDYGFEGEDGDLDDPLLVVAQADSVAIARPLAERP